MTLRLFTAALVLLCTCGQANAEVDQHAVLVHLRPGSAAATQWIAANRSGTLPELTRIIGEHTATGYVSNATLQAIEMASSKRDGMRKARPDEAIAHIALVRYFSSLPPQIAARKIAQFKDVEYCEPLPVFRLLGGTNDPLLPQQYYISLIKAIDAWDSLPQGSPIIVGIADTGIDTTHQDLRGQIWNNPGETGLDDQGVDRRFNKVDDDRNGFVDDWYGWDFIGSTGQNEDNSPLPGNPHGTHVGGIVAAAHNNAIGIAGVGKNIRLLPLKIGGDDQFSTSISRSADAILYAASMGASVINCSFGSPSSSFADVKVVKQAAALGSMIVAAAGNDGQDLAYYPAAYDEVLSVAATDFSDRIAAFSNVHQSVDVCAPGVSILSTVPTDSYEPYDGTSMASPVAAAVAAMVRLVHPEYSPAQVHATLKAACVSIDFINPNEIGLIGSGRISAPRALSSSKLKWAEVTSYVYTDVDKDSVFEASDTLVVGLTIRNILGALDSCHVKFSNGNSEINVDLLDSALRIGKLDEGESRTFELAARVVLPSNVPNDGQLRILAHVYNGAIQITTSSLQTVVNPTYRTINGNDITVTVNSTGNIGFNDYSANVQGVGLRYLQKRNILFEGALLVGTEPAKLPNVARGFETSAKERSFRTIENAFVRSDSIPSGLRVRSLFSDADDSSPLGIQVRSNVIAMNGDSTRNSLLIALRITNTTDSAFTNLHVAEFFDFDISDGSINDLCEWNSDDKILSVRSVLNDSLPQVGLAMISPLTLSAFAMDNEGASDCPSIYDDFLRSEKWFVMTGGVRRPKSRITDVSSVIGAGPIVLKPDSTVEVCFALSVGNTYNTVRTGILGLQRTARALGYNVGDNIIPTADDEIVSLSGGTLQSAGSRELTFRLNDPASVTIDLVDLRGAKVSMLYSDPYIDAGLYVIPVELPEVAAGIYVIRMVTERGVSAIPIFIASSK